MREKLIELIEEAENICQNKDPVECATCEYARKPYPCTNGLIADHLLADGWIRPPCKVGDKVYALVNDIDGSSVEIMEADVIYHEDDGCKTWSLGFCQYDQFGKVTDVAYKTVYEEQFGKAVFLSREDAEKALKKGKRNEAR